MQRDIRPLEDRLRANREFLVAISASVEANSISCAAVDPLIADAMWTEGAAAPAQVLKVQARSLGIRIFLEDGDGGEIGHGLIKSMKTSLLYTISSGAT